MTTEDANRSLERAAVDLDPSLSAEEKARRLNPALKRQAEESERRGDVEDFDAADAAPSQASEGVAEHEQEMQRRGFEKAGPPE